MLLAYDYPLAGIVVTMLWLFFWVVWLMCLFHVIADIFRSHDMGGFAKAAWLTFVVFLPFLGVFVYVVARGQGMGDRVDEARRERFERDRREFEPTSAGSASVGDQIAQLGRLHQEGIISDADYDAARAKVLA